MRILRHFTDVPAGARGAVAAIGNFDGVHRGHQVLIGEAGRLARAKGVPHAVMTFEPHPRSVFAPEAPPFRLTPLRTKLRHIELLGVDIAFVLHFDLDFSRKTPRQFVEEALVDGLDVRHVVVGYDFIFGHKRQGNPALLQEVAEAAGFGVTRVDPIIDRDHDTFSSTKIRDYLRSGRPDLAAALLGRDWEIDGRVEHGEQRGRDIGFPTANLDLGEYLRPAPGVYAVRAGIDQGENTVWHDGVANLGRRPTFGGDGLVLEAHLFDFDGDLYGRHLRVAFVGYVRSERRYDSIDELRAQIAADCGTARRLLAERVAADAAPTAATALR